MLTWEILDAIKDLGNSKAFFIFFLTVIIDVTLGKFRAYKQGTFTSYTGVQGLIKHISIILIQIAVSVCARLIGYKSIGYSLCVFFIFDYLVSIYANAEILGINLPDITITKEEVERKLKKNDLHLQ